MSLSWVTSCYLAEKEVFPQKKLVIPEKLVFADIPGFLRGCHSNKILFTVTSSCYKNCPIYEYFFKISACFPSKDLATFSDGPKLLSVNGTRNTRNEKEESGLL